ncbi:MAG TPA: hypothetical protein VK184_11945 [Nostocaceae cyanobacterium]|nr:hypothetical protein [Nostocaceae cyanobacterium]
MNIKSMISPSSLIPEGVKMIEFGNIYIFKFTDKLQTRFEELLTKKKSSKITPDEAAEYVGIIELQKILTLANAELMRKCQWCPLQIEKLFPSS